MKRFVFFSPLLFLMLLTSETALAQAQNTPVIIIMCDQLRYDAIGRNTPHINQLKEDGISFNRTYCASPLCAPSRAAFFTGNYPNNNGSLINGWQPEDEHFGEVKSGTKNLYEVMSRNWESWHVGKQHFFTQDKIDKNPNSGTQWITEQTYKQWIKTAGQKAPGGSEFKTVTPELVSDKYTIAKNYSAPEFAEYKPGLKYFNDDYYAQKSVDIIKEHAGNRPLLLNLMFLSPHPPFNVPEPYFSKFTPGDLAIPENVGKWYPEQSPLQLYNLAGFIGSRYSRDQWTQIWPKYFGLVSLVDDELERYLMP